MYLFRKKYESALEQGILVLPMSLEYEKQSNIWQKNLPVSCVYMRV